MPRRFEPDDLLLEQRITDLHLLPGHPLALCAVQSTDRDSRQSRSALWTFHLHSAEARLLTPGPGCHRQPRWSPDGQQIAFLSDRGPDGQPQLMCMPIDGGEARTVTHLARGLTQVAWRPDGRQLLGLGQVSVDPDERAAGCERQDGADAPPRDPDAPRLCWRLPYKLDGSGYLLDSRVQLFLIEADSGDTRQLTRGDAEVRHAAWAPDGRRICFVRTRDNAREAHCTDVWVLTLREDGQPGAPRRLSHDQAVCASPSWSPDGRWIVFSGARDAGDAQMRLWRIDMDNGQVEPLGDDAIEVMPGELHWRQDSSEVAFVQVQHGLQRVAAIRVPEGEVRLLVDGERQVDRLAAGDSLIFTSETADTPMELFHARWKGGDSKQLSHLNAWWQQRRRPHVRYRHFQLPDGQGGTETIDGWLLTPDREPASPTPLLIDAHGGPASYVLLPFHYHPYWQILCSRGWSVLALNTVGSSSYGRAFAERLRAHWGERDLPQVLGAIEQLQQEGIADERVAMAGMSYGGYLSAYAIGHSHVFRAAVVCAPVANMESHFGTSDSGYYADAYSSEGKPDEQREQLARLSPMSAIERVRTPTLFLQGMEDERCPRGQAEELFVKLQRAGGAPTELVLYPGGSHHVFSTGKADHRIDVQQRIVDWLERWVLHDGGATPG